LEEEEDQDAFKEISTRWEMRPSRKFPAADFVSEKDGELEFGEGDDEWALGEEEELNEVPPAADASPIDE
jgi:hypothetical protein